MARLQRAAITEYTATAANEIWMRKFLIPLLLASVLLQSCAALDQKDISTTGWLVVPETTHRIAQVGFGQDAQFILCANCPTPTTKTPFTAPADTVKHLSKIIAVPTLVRQAPVFVAAAQHNQEIPAVSANDAAVPDRGVAEARVQTLANKRHASTGTARSSKPESVSDLQNENAPKVYFAINCDNLDRTARNTLKSVLGRAKNAKRIELTGYSDASGTSPHNHMLSGRRAAAVKKYLVAHGVDAEIVHVPEDKCCRVLDNTTSTGKLLKRRVEIEIFD